MSHIISKETLEAALAMLPLASKDPTRFNISGVHLDIDGSNIRLQATNGHLMMSRLIPGSLPAGKFILRHDEAPAIKLVLKEMKNISDIPCELNSSGSLVVGHFTKALISKANSDYPDLKQVVPVQKETISLGFNADYIAAIAKAMSIHKRSNPNVKITFDPSDPLKPFFVDKGDLRAVLMPVRMEA